MCSKPTANECRQRCEDYCGLEVWLEDLSIATAHVTNAADVRGRTDKVDLSTGVLNLATDM